MWVYVIQASFFNFLFNWVSFEYFNNIAQRSGWGSAQSLEYYSSLFHQKVRHKDRPIPETWALWKLGINNSALRHWTLRKLCSTLALRYQVLLFPFQDYNWLKFEAFPDFGKESEKINKILWIFVQQLARHHMIKELAFN